MTFQLAEKKGQFNLFLRDHRRAVGPNRANECVERLPITEVVSRGTEYCVELWSYPIRGWHYCPTVRADQEHGG